MIPALIYSLCALTALGCTFLLLRGYRRSGHRLLFWSGLCFAGLTLNNLLLVIDKVALPGDDLSIARTGVALLSMAILLFGLIWDSDK
jgi:hypothetical protein